MLKLWSKKAKPKWRMKNPRNSWVTDLFNKTMPPSKPITSRHCSNRCVLFTCKCVQFVKTDWERCFSREEHSSVRYSPSWINSGYTRFAGLIFVSWNAALTAGDLRLRRGRLLIGYTSKIQSLVIGTWQINHINFLCILESVLKRYHQKFTKSLPIQPRCYRFTN